MKVLKVKPELCIACHACETACSTTWFKEDNAEKSCIRIKEEDAGNKIISCSQCGECIDVCPVQAITRDKNGIVRINKSTCVGCYICVGFCPEMAMFMRDEFTEPFKCVACGQCAKQCPTGALSIEEV